MGVLYWLPISVHTMVSGEQIRAARAMVRVERDDLAARAGVSGETIKRLERTIGQVSGNPSTVDAVVGVLQSAGVAFTHSGVSISEPLKFALKVLAFYVARHADKFVIDGNDSPSGAERAKIEGRIKGICRQIEALADRTPEQTVRYSEFDALLDDLKRLKTYPTNEQVSAVARAFVDYEMSVSSDLQSRNALLRNKIEELLPRAPREAQDAVRSIVLAQSPLVIDNTEESRRRVHDNLRKRADVLIRANVPGWEGLKDFLYPQA
jgi:hypothetical protein